MRRGQRVNEDKEGEKRVHTCLSDGCIKCSPIHLRGIFPPQDQRRGVCGPHQVGAKVFQPSNSERHEQWHDADVPRYGCDDGDKLETMSAWNHRERKGNTKCVRINYNNTS